MRYFLFSSFILINLLVACNNNKGNKKVVDSNKDSTSVELSEPDAVLQRMEKMKKLVPFNAERVKALFPEEFAGTTKSDYTAINNEGYEAGEAHYKSDDGKELDVTIFDCAGEAGAGKYNIMFASYLNTESADDNGYKKSIRFNGDKAIESYDKKQDRYALLFLSGDRLLINVEGNGADIVKQAAGRLASGTN